MDERDIATNKKLSEETGLSSTFLSNILNSEKEFDKVPEVDKFITLAKYFGVSVDWLLGLSGTRYQEDDDRAAVSRATHLSDKAIAVLSDDYNSDAAVAPHMSDYVLSFVRSVINDLLTERKGQELLQAIGMYLNTHFQDYHYVRDIFKDDKNSSAMIPSELVENGALYTVAVRAKEMRDLLVEREKSNKDTDGKED